MEHLLGERLQQEILGNSLERWAASGSIAAGVLILGLVLKGFLTSRLRRYAHATATRWDDVALIALDRTGPLFLLVTALHFGTQSLEVHPKLAAAREYLFFLFLFYQLGVWLTSALKFYGESYFRETLQKEPSRATTISALILLGDVTIWMVMALLLLSNYKVDVSALITGLGVGGVAVALALQSILGDLFASLAIVLDKPFVIGDAIHVNGLSGTVEHIGLKTTRIRAVTGEQLIFSNSDLLKNVVKNFKRMERRRVTFTFGLVYETPPAKLGYARELVKEVVEAERLATFERCHLAVLAASSLDFEVAYWVETSDYNAYVNAHHGIMAGLLQRFESAGLEFAYPHQVSIPKATPHAARS